MQKKYIDGFLDEAEQQKLGQFMKDEVMANAVKKVLLAGIYETGVLAGKKGKPIEPLINPALGFVSNARELGASNEVLGEDLRAYWEGLKALENGFDNMKHYVPKPERSPKSNPAL